MRRKRNDLFIPEVNALVVFLLVLLAFLGVSRFCSRAGSKGREGGREGGIIVSRHSLSLRLLYYIVTPNSCNKYITYSIL